LPLEQVLQQPRQAAAHFAPLARPHALDLLGQMAASMADHAPSRSSSACRSVHRTKSSS